MTNRPGQWFVSKYYKYSPPLADTISERSWARMATRAGLTPVVIVAGALIGQPHNIAIMFVFLIIYSTGSYLLWRRIRMRNDEQSENAES